MQIAAATVRAKEPACRWLRLSSHNTAVQRLIVMESLPAVSSPSRTETPRRQAPAQTFGG